RRDHRPGRDLPGHDRGGVRPGGGPARRKTAGRGALRRAVQTPSPGRRAHLRRPRSRPRGGGAVPPPRGGGEQRRLGQPPHHTQVSASPVRRQIVAMGGGSFSVEPDGSALDAYVLGLTGKPHPKICFVPTASGDAPEYTAKFYDAFARRAAASHLYLLGRPRTDMAKHLASQDIIYVGGGNTANMLAVWRVHGVDQMMRGAWEQGVILTGVSAGMICWFECGVTDSFGPLAALRDGLGLLSGSACPHYDGERDRRPTYQQLVRRGLPTRHPPGDGAAPALGDPHPRGRRAPAAEGG